MGIAVLITNDSKKEKLYSMNLKMYVGLETIAKETVERAIPLIQNMPSIDLIICKEKIAGENSSQLIIEYCRDHSIRTPLMFIGEDKKLLNFGSLIKEDADLKSFVWMASRSIGVTAKEMFKEQVPEYISIPLRYFYPMSSSICDAYRIEIAENENENVQNEKTYKKIIWADSDYSKSEIQALSDEGVTHLFVKSQDRLKFTNNLSFNLINKLENANLTVPERLDSNAEIMGIVNDQIKELGISPETVQMANACISSMLKVAKDMPKLGLLMQSLLSRKDSYAYTHCQLITYISFHIIERMEWGNAEQQEKLSFVAFFHDITLFRDEQIMIMSDSELENASDLSEKEKKAVHKHAYTASVMVQKYANCPIGADTIIRQHHGAHNGMGLDESPAFNLSPLSIVFIVAEEYSHFVLTSGMNNKTIIESLYKMHEGKEKYHNAIRTLEEIEGID